MSCYRDLCSYPSAAPCHVACPQPLANAWNEPCVTSCGDSRAVIYPPPVVVTFPGPILSSCPQESVVGSAAPAAVGSNLGYGASFGVGSNLGYGASFGVGSNLGYGASFGYRSSLGYGGSLGSRFSSCSQRSQCFSSRRSEPCDIQREHTRTRSSQDTTCKVQTQE